VEAIPGVQVTSIDIDDKCILLGERLKLIEDNITFVTANMQDFIDYSQQTKLVINTSTEHISQTTFDIWFNHIPSDVNIVLQGNNFFTCQEHVRCTSSLVEFKQINRLSNIIFEGSLDCIQFTRYMTIGKK
jgi:hypothetical protein